MNSNIQTFIYEGCNVRTVNKNDEIWFVAKDVCDILELNNITEALRELDEDELTSEFLKSGGQSREMRLITESGLYSLIFRSNKPEAKNFSRWVRHEVLPQIRATGNYISHENSLNVMEIKHLCSERCKIKQRLDFFHEIRKSYAGFENILFRLATGRRYYDWPEYTCDDRKDLSHLQNILRLAQDFTDTKIQTLESRINTLEALTKF